METILVPTDFSSNAMAGVRYAINLAKNMAAKLRFVYVHAPGDDKATLDGSKSDGEAKDAQEQKVFYLNKLQALVEEAYEETDLEPGPYSCVFIKGCQAYQSLLDYIAADINIKYIVMGTKGEDNRSEGAFGSNTDKLIVNSGVPVIAISS